MEQFRIEISDKFQEIDITISRELDYNLSKLIQKELDELFQEDDAIADYQITHVIGELC